MTFRTAIISAFTLTALSTVVLSTVVLSTGVLSGAAYARDFEMGGDFPYSIMAPEPGTHHQGRPVKSQPIAPASPATVHAPRHLYDTVRGSSGSVLSTPLPRTELIPPEGSGKLNLPNVPSEQGPTILQGATNPIPNLPHGTESFQDRASRCSFQAGLNNVPGTLTNQYMGVCVH
jgi:hypothetical protein